MQNIQAISSCTKFLMATELQVFVLVQVTTDALLVRISLI